MELLNFFAKKFAVQAFLFLIWGFSMLLYNISKYKNHITAQNTKTEKYGFQGPVMTSSMV